MGWIVSWPRILLQTASSQGRASTDRGVQRADRASAGWSRPTWMYGSGAESQNRSLLDGMLPKCARDDRNSEVANGVKVDRRNSGRGDVETISLGLHFYSSVARL